MDVKDLIKQKRLERGLTMKELGEKVGVSEATISRWESGDIATMKHSKIASLSKALDISPAAIVPGGGISYREDEMLKIFRTLSENAQQELIGCLQRKGLNINELFEQRSLTQEEREYLEMFRALPEGEQRTIKRNIRWAYQELEIEAKEKGVV